MWLYEGKEFTSEDIDNYIGFVYLITNKINGMQYVGKKLFKFSRRQKVKGRKNRKVVVKESDWKDYYGSNDRLNEAVLEHGPENFTREILHLCENKTECSYLELYEQVTRNALIDDKYYNGIIQCRISNKGLSKLWLNS